MKGVFLSFGIRLFEFQLPKVFYFYLHPTAELFIHFSADLISQSGQKLYHLRVSGAHP